MADSDNLHPYLDGAHKIIEEEADSGIESQHIIAFGPGALQKWALARRSFRKLVEEVRIKASQGGWTRVSLRWLGYNEPDSPYYVVKTTLPVTDSQHTVGLLLSRSGCTSIDFICHSLMGLITVYWAATAPQEELDKVRQIITISSPLRGSDDYLDRLIAYQESHRDNPPKVSLPKGVFEDLKPSSKIMQAIRESESRLAGKLVPISIEGDSIVPPEIASVAFISSKTITLKNPGLDPHTNALQDEGVITEVLAHLGNPPRAHYCKSGN